MPTLSASERIGTTVGGRYEIRRLLGEGGFSAVFESVHNVTGREVALKLLHGHLTTTEQITERFLMEARAMAKIRHDGIVQVLDAGRDPDGTIFIALELLNGESLEQTLDRVGRLTWGESLAIGIDVLTALAEAHKAKIVHRDIKPGNIFVVRKPDGGSQAKLLDFGIAQVAQAKGRLTQSGTILGTPEYMSPEQGRGVNIGPEADLWSVGIVLFECLTGTTPFAAEATTDVLVKVATERAPSLASMGVDVPTVVARAIDRAIEREVTVRYRSADEMREALQNAMREVDRRRHDTPARGTALRESGGRRAIDFQTDLAPRSERSSGERMELGPPTRPSSTAMPRVAASAAQELEFVPREGRSSGPVAVNTSWDAETFNLDEGHATGSAPRSHPGHDTPSGVMNRRQLPEGFEKFGMPPPELTRPTPAPMQRGGAGADPPARRPATGDFPLPPGWGQHHRPSAPPPARAATPPNRAAPPTSYADRADRPSMVGFQAPPDESRLSKPLIAAGVAFLVLGLGAFAWSRRTTETTPVPPTVTPRNPRAVPTPSEPAPASASTVRFRDLHAIGLPSGLTGLDSAAEFARHTAVSSTVGVTQRVVATCLVRGDGSPTVFVHPLNAGPVMASASAEIACDGYDLGVVQDLTNDGSDDIVAVASQGAGLVVLDSRSLRVWRSYRLPGARGIAKGAVIQLADEPAAVVFTEPAGVNGPSAVVAVGLRSQRTLWRIQGGGGFERVGQPVELGLSVGPDANGDGVSDVVVGLGALLGASPGPGGPRRCVQAFSGATGQPLWPMQCQAGVRSAQSVALGPDVDGDGRGDVLVGTDQPLGDEAPVRLLSGADGHLLRTFAAPADERGNGFGWPVALSGDLNGDHRADVAIGSVGANTAVTVFDAASGAVHGRLPLGGAGGGNLRVYPVNPVVPTQPWLLLVGNPADGVHLYAADLEEGS